jgi:hypothetical protein
MGFGVVQLALFRRAQNRSSIFRADRGVSTGGQSSIVIKYVDAGRESLGFGIHLALLRKANRSSFPENWRNLTNCK